MSNLQPNCCLEFEFRKVDQHAGGKCAPLPLQHWCRWVLLSFHAFVRPSNHPWAWVCVLHTKRLEEMAYNLACWCIQMAYTQHSWMLMDIVVGLSVRPSVRLFIYGIFRWLCICWQITWNKWHKIWHITVTTMQYLQILHCMAFNSQGQASKVTFM